MMSGNDGKRFHDSEDDFLNNHGKWVILGSKEYIKNLVSDINILVDTGLLEYTKYSKKSGYDLLPNRKEYVICVYSDFRDSDFVRKLISFLGVDNVMWEYDRNSDKNGAREAN